MHDTKKTLRLATALSLLLLPTMGCNMEVDDENLDDFIEEEGPVGEAQSASAAGLILCSSPGVHPSTPAGDTIHTRDTHDDITGISGHQCAVLGQVFWDQNTDEVFEIAASPSLASYSDDAPTCGHCLALHGNSTPSPAPGSTISFYSRVTAPTAVEPLGWRGGAVSHYQGWGQSFYHYSGWPWSSLSSYCSTAWGGKYYGPMTNARGYEMVPGTSGGEWGYFAYTMKYWVPGWGTYIYAASTDTNGTLQFTPRTDICN